MGEELKHHRTSAKVPRLHRVYFNAFVLAMVVCWSPFKGLAYLVPFLVLLWIAFASDSRHVRRRLMQWFGAWLVGILLYASMRSDFVLPSALIALVTYGTFAFVFVLPSRFLRSSNLLKRMLAVVAVFVVLQSLVGIVQAGYGFAQTGTFDLNTGDYVEGTIHPSLEPESAFANPMFATNMAFMLLALMPVVALQKRWRIVFLFGALVLVLASVMHVLMFLFTGLLFAFLLYRPPISPRAVRATVFTLCLLIPGTAYFLLRANIGSLTPIVQDTLAAATPRALVTLRAIHEMPAEYAWMPFVGLGPGQFSSRASLIGTGMFFGGIQDPKPVPLIPTGSSHAFQDYLQDLWYAVADNPYWGSTQKPFYSWLSIYTEFGVVALASIFFIAFRILFKLRSKVETVGQRILATAMGAGVILFLLLGMQENYWEVPQAIFVGAMLLKVLYAQLAYSARTFVNPTKGTTL